MDPSCTQPFWYQAYDAAAVTASQTTPASHWCKRLAGRSSTTLPKGCGLSPS